MEAGVPQGSVLGPILRNYLYDGILNLDWLDKVTVIAYVDDLVVLLEGKDVRDPMFKANDISEAAILKGPHTEDNIRFELRENEIRPGRQLKYLGVILDQRQALGPHVRYATENAEATLLLY